MEAEATTVEQPKRVEFISLMPTPEQSNQGFENWLRDFNNHIDALAAKRGALGRGEVQQTFLRLNLAMLMLGGPSNQVARQIERLREVTDRAVEVLKPRNGR